MSREGQSRGKIRMSLTGWARGWARHVLELAVAREGLWDVLRATLIRVADAAREARRRQTALGGQEFIESLNELVVRHGPFEGLRYPEARSTGSTLPPKLLGSYEKELHSVVEEICAEELDVIVDIGCAEGYYAVGFARRLAKTRVFAFDINPEAQRLCAAMARLNGVADRVDVLGACTPETFKHIPLGRKALILSDCEGYEKELFVADVVDLLAQHSVLVELHDCLDIEISAVIRDRFSRTHDIRSIHSTDDIRKAHDYVYPELAGFDLRRRMELLGEGRPTEMEWYYMTPRVTEEG